MMEGCAGAICSVFITFFEVNVKIKAVPAIPKIIPIRNDQVEKEFWSSEELPVPCELEEDTVFCEEVCEMSPLKSMWY